MPFSTFLPFRRTTFAGTPTAVASAGMSEITTAPAPIFERSPITTGPKI